MAISIKTIPSQAHSHKRLGQEINLKQPCLQIEEVAHSQGLGANLEDDRYPPTPPPLWRFFVSIDFPELEELINHLTSPVILEAKKKLEEKIMSIVWEYRFWESIND